jgi:hypothetical protein
MVHYGLIKINSQINIQKSILHETISVNCIQLDPMGENMKHKYCSFIYQIMVKY